MSGEVGQRRAPRGGHPPGYEEILSQDPGNPYALRGIARTLSTSTAPKKP